MTLFEINEEVAVRIPGLPRPLYGIVTELQGLRYRVQVSGERGDATIEVDGDQLSRWRRGAAKGVPYGS